ncbi:MAG: hypothetical protein LBQ89_04435 [Treponema sp.]|nr:hypothetical protein [Treponema sp.]
MMALYLALLNGFNIDGKRTHIIDETFAQNCNGGYQGEDTLYQEKSGGCLEITEIRSCAYGRYIYASNLEY